MTPRIIAIIVAGLTVAACSPKVPTELALAREAYQRASQGPAAELAPAEVHKAQEALKTAEEAFEQRPRHYLTLDLAYVAQRQAEIADVMGTIAVEEKRTAEAASQFVEVQAALLDKSQADLAKKEGDLAKTESDLSAAQGQVVDAKDQAAAAELRSVAAEKRAAEAMDALGKLVAVKEEARGMVITLSGSVLFASNEAILLPEAQTRLGQVADALLESKDRRLTVEGHTDAQGTDETNASLAQRRAEAVRDFLVSRGYDAANITVSGVGEARPVADNGTAEGRANNRRVEIIVAKE